MDIELTDEQVDRFQEDGFLIVDRLIDPEVADRVAARFEPLFRGDFETGLQPDEFNWKEGRDPTDLTRQICNAWKSDRVVAGVVLSESIGRACARLGGWSGTRVNQDNVLWKPPGARPLGMHQDGGYLDWMDPPTMVSCWIALGDTRADGGPVEHVRGSHLWGRGERPRVFHGPSDYQAEMRAAARVAGIQEPEIVPVVVPKGGGAFHHAWTWHGSDTNRSGEARRALVVHAMPEEARFHPKNRGYAYGRYKRFGSVEMDESFFPITWSARGKRSWFIEGYVRGDL